MTICSEKVSRELQMLIGAAERPVWIGVSRLQGGGVGVFVDSPKVQLHSVIPKEDLQYDPLASVFKTIADLVEDLRI